MANDNPNVAESATQCATILALLKEGKRITSHQASRDYGIDRLASRIWDLKERKHNIKDRYITVLNRFNREVRVKEYWLEEDDKEVN